ncbi:hypothetical protein C8J36_101574 [Rhizobium sp. PP-F2F-G48]|nr:hypothetical protein C8J36_101574 [Rhizobium sp. PP-F2F-G48]
MFLIGYFHAGRPDRIGIAADGTRSGMIAAKV